MSRPEALLAARRAARDDFLRDALLGLTDVPKRLPSKYFYDHRGALLFDRICRLAEYYPTRTEIGIMREHVAEMAARIGPRCTLIELGSGSGLKTRILLRALTCPLAYIPVDISQQQLYETAAALEKEVPELLVLPIHTDFTQEFDVPRLPRARKSVVYFPGSTIGNVEPREAVLLMSRIGELVGPGGGLLIGVDLRKDVVLLEAAYNDALGVTAEFNRNVLVRLRDELDAEVDPDLFSHRAFYNHLLGRVEMHLVSTVPQVIRIGSVSISLQKGETIHTENSYKYDLEGFAALGRAAGLRRSALWTDPDLLFSVQYFVRPWQEPGAGLDPFRDPC
jgi:L-histidine N-alpha-methyltransferase